MRRFNSSKLLLLYGVIHDDNVANNGGGFNARKLCGPKRSVVVLKLIPWEVVVGAKPPTRGQSRTLRGLTRKEEILSA